MPYVKYKYLGINLTVLGVSNKVAIISIVQNLVIGVIFYAQPCAHC